MPETRALRLRCSLPNQAVLSTKRSSFSSVAVGRRFVRHLYVEECVQMSGCERVREGRILRHSREGGNPIDAGGTSTFPGSVIPAKAGIHLLRARSTNARGETSPGLHTLSVNGAGDKPIRHSRESGNPSSLGNELNSRGKTIPQLHTIHLTERGTSPRATKRRTHQSAERNTPIRHSREGGNPINAGGTPTFPGSVIPAKAGIHLLRARCT